MGYRLSNTTHQGQQPSKTMELGKLSEKNAQCVHGVSRSSFVGPKTVNKEGLVTHGTFVEYHLESCWN